MMECLYILFLKVTVAILGSELSLLHSERDMLL